MEQKNNFKKIIDWERVTVLLGIAIVGAVITILGDFLMGWELRENFHNFTAYQMIGCLCQQLLD